MIRIDTLTKTYDKGTKQANEVLHGLSLTLPDTGFVCILGPSGCGKTSLLNAIGGLDTFEGGRIVTDGAIITRRSTHAMEKERNRSFGYIFQNYYLLSEHSAAYNVYLGMHSLGLSRKEKLRRVKEALERVDMLRYRRRTVGELSGGQQQRVAIARAIARRPRVIFADEPTGNLDEANTMNICTILKELSRESLVIMVTHEERIARFFADRIVTLNEGRIVSDLTDWDHGTLDSGAKDTLYAGDYEESSLTGDSISLRLLTADGTSPVSLTVIAEADRIVIKTADPRVVLCSDTTSAPYLAEGKRPILHSDSLVAPVEEDRTMSKTSGASAPAKQGRKGLDPSLLFQEARSLLSGRKRKRFGTGVFLVLLSVMLSVLTADFLTVSRIDPEDFITTDSHLIGFTFERGPLAGDKHLSIDSYIEEFRAFLDASGCDFDYLPSSNNSLQYRDATVPQFGNLSLELGQNRVNLSRLDPETLIMGRMPTRSDEIVVDRWVIDRLLEEEGILQNVIPNAAYLLGKTVTSPRKSYTLTVVGICDSGEPSVYLSTEALLAFGTCGTEVITLSEYQRLTGTLDDVTLGPDECIVLRDNVNQSSGTVSINSFVGSAYHFREVMTLNDTDDSIGAKLIVADETLAPLYRSMIRSLNNFYVWCTDKETLYASLDGEFPETLKGMLSIDAVDTYAGNMADYREKTDLKLNARTVVTVTVVLSCAVMLYLMQRSKVRERMDLISVYRLLGIPRGDLLSVFAMESLFLTVRFALPTVLAVWAVLKVMAGIAMLSGAALYFPLEAALLTLLAIALYRLLIATVPVLRLLTLPPAKLAAKYDF